MRKFASAGVVLGVVLLAAWPLMAGAQGGAKVSFSSPTEGSTVTGPKVKVTLKIESFKTVPAGTAVAPGEGHAHIFVDMEPTAAGQNIPTDQPTKIIHMGAAPFDSRDVELTPGRHTLQVALADSSHKALTPAATSKVTFTVAAAGQASPPARAADTGDGSLADDGIGIGALLALGLGGGALLSRRMARR